MIKLSENSKKVFKNLYCFSNESIDDAFKRVADEFGSDDEEKDLAYKLQRDGIWRPNTPVYLNAGTKRKIFSACYVTSLSDSMDSIYDIANVSRKIFGYGAGVGIPLGNLRGCEESIFCGEPDTPPEGKSSGPITFMKLYDAVGETTKSGGRVRRAAIMCSMQCWHPDIMAFISSKETDGTYSNMNISVSFTDKFMEHLKDNVPFPLITPYDGSQVDTISPKDLWNKLVETAHKVGDPGVIFIDTVNRFNPLKKKILIETSNPCVTGDTLVLTNKGLFSVEYLLNEEIDDTKILSYNIENEEIVFSDIKDVFMTKKNAEIIELHIEENDKIYTLKCTPDHRIYTRNRGYVQAKDLNEDDDIVVNKTEP